MTDLFAAYRLAWRHDKGGLFATLLIPAALWIAAMLGVAFS